MSHLKERKEKICLNCHTALSGRYCHVCGQENLEPKETVWHLVQHFFNDITHFDGKFFSTVKYLMRKPGFLSKEYMAGRRMTYLNPIRMYVFTSAIFFLIFFSLKRPGEFMHVNETADKEVKKSLTELEKLKLDDEKKMKTADDEDDRQDYANAVRKLDVELAMIKSSYGDTTKLTFSKADRKLLLARALTDSTATADTSKGYRYPGIPSHLRDSLNKLIRLGKIPDTGSHTTVLGWDVSQYKSVEAYDSSEKRLPDSLQDGWFKRLVMHKSIVAGEELHRDKRLYFEHFAEHMLHSFPKILFWSLPFFALILNILYFRHKQYYYVDHGIFTIHVYCAIFILALATILLNQLGSLGWEWLKVTSEILNFLIFIYIMIYLYKAMRGFYGQGRGKTFLKYLIACFLAFIINTILLVIFVLISAVSV
ncbi:MAG TPA: DUF3667 domain-containing protein [Puia sp.]|nr:DUF3667 domain-containing protein [Puia sp.]